MRTWFDDARAWAGDANPWFRMPLYLYGFFVVYRVLTRASTFTPFDWLNVGIHELGHVIAIPFGQFVHVAGGSFLQLAVPFGSVFMFVRQRDYFAASFCFCWLAESFLNLSHYIGDAVVQALPLATPFGGEPLHDWHFLLDKMGMLSRTLLIARCAQVLAFGSVLVYLVAGGWLLWHMVFPAKKRGENLTRQKEDHD